jgi:hypothetical protein
MNFQKSRDFAFEKFANAFENTPKFFAMYSDNELKRGMKGNTDDEVKEKMKWINSIFELLHSRDVFFKTYTKLLSSRLLNAATLSDEYEKQLIAQLKNLVGTNSSYIRAITQMLDDMELSKTYTSEFESREVEPPLFYIYPRKKIILSTTQETLQFCQQYIFLSSSL